MAGGKGVSIVARCATADANGGQLARLRLCGLCPAMTDPRRLNSYLPIRAAPPALETLPAGAEMEAVELQARPPCARALSRACRKGEDVGWGGGLGLGAAASLCKRRLPINDLGCQWRVLRDHVS